MATLPEVCGPLRVIAYVDQVEEATFAPLKSIGFTSGHSRAI